MSLAITELGISSRSFARVTIVVARHAIPLTCPTCVPLRIQSPGSNGRPIESDSPLKMLPRVSCNAKPSTAAKTVVVVRIESGCTPKSVYSTTITTTNHNVSISRSLVMVEKCALPRRVIASTNSSTSRITPNRKSTKAATAVFWPTSSLGMKRDPASISALPDSSRKVVAVTARRRRRTANAPSSPNRTSTLSTMVRQSRGSTSICSIVWSGVGAIVQIPAATAISSSIFTASKYSAAISRAARAWRG